MLPKGTKIYYDKKYEEQKKFCTCYCCQYDIYGKVKARSGGEEDLPSSGKLEDWIKICSLWDSKKNCWKWNSKNEFQYINILVKK